MTDKNDLLTLNDFTHLPTVQAYVAAVEKARGFDGDDLRQKILYMAEEVGELSKCVRKSTGGLIEKGREMDHIEGEVADILLVLCALANRLDIDIAQAFADKEVKNRKRVWQSN